MDAEARLKKKRTSAVVGFFFLKAVNRGLNFLLHRDPKGFWMIKLLIDLLKLLIMGVTESLKKKKRSTGAGDP